MPKVIYVEHSGTEHEIDVSVGDSLMQAAQDNDVPGIEGICGGSLSCATCHCYVDPTWLNRLDSACDNELDMLDNTESERKQNSRLSCQIVMSDALDGVRVDLPESQI